MTQSFQGDTGNDVTFRLLGVAALIAKIRKGITNEELHRDAERKFDTMTDLLGNAYSDDNILSEQGYSLADLKEVSLSILNRLISNGSRNPYMHLCAAEGSSLEELKRRRNRLLHLFHPDKEYAEYADADKTRKINEAFEKIVREYNTSDIPYVHSSIHVPPPYPAGRYQNCRKLKMIVAITIFLTLLTSFSLYLIFH